MSTLGQFDNYAGYKSSQSVQNVPTAASFNREFYSMLQAYYNNNGLYDIINTELEATRITEADLKPLRNPAFRVVEFYAAKMWPGTLPEALPIETENDAIIDPIHQIWKWSNFSSTKQRAARWFATFGDMFIKVATRANQETGASESVFLQFIEPKYVTAFDVDERGFLTYIRIDTPQTRRKENGDTEEYTHTEVWDKDSQIWRIWEHEDGLDVELGEISAVPEDGTIEEATGDNFLPFVYQQFRDDGQDRANAAFAGQLDKIDEANRMATRLHQMLLRYNQALWAMMANGVDQSGRPLPPPSVANITNDDGNLELEDDTIIQLPGMSRLEALTPNINYGDALLTLQDQMQEIKRDLPELAYYDLREMNQTSGRAARYLLDDAISRLLEARGNGETALIRAHEMALTIGQNLGLDAFKGIGSFEDGSFIHTFADRPVLPLDETESVTTQKTKAETFTIQINNGVDRETAALSAGYSLEEAQAMAASGGRVLPQDTDVNDAIDSIVDAETAVTDGDTPENLESDKGLNGAQANAAKDLASGVSLGTDSPIVATEILVGLGIDPASVKRMIDAAVAFKPRSVDDAA
ncbi:MAG: phage portal protein [Ketobacter sp.]|nr:phage portal protein [Ketobacter sp.]